MPILRDGETRPFAHAPLRAGELALMAFHPLGTARAGADPAASVVDGRGRVHGVGGVHVLDGAMVPSALGVNPQITIMALATRAAFALLGAPAPDEPAPERMAVPRPATPVARRASGNTLWPEMVTRDQALSALTSEPFDLVVVGGGITGAGVALDAASRGFAVALVEKRDYAAGTSSRSSKLVHGGLRYLQQFDVGLVREALLERQLLTALAPHLVRPLQMVVPAFEGGHLDRLVGRGAEHVRRPRAGQAPPAAAAPSRRR